MAELPEVDQAKEKLTYLTKNETINAVKTAVKELVQEQVTAFGWWSLKTLGVAMVGAIIIASVYIDKWGK